MGKFDYGTLGWKEREALIKPLVEVFYTLKTKERLREFLTTLLTPSELFMLARRILVAEHLVEGESYETVRRKTGVGFSTIQSVDSWLKYAVTDYHDIRAKQRREEERKQRLEQRLKGRLAHHGNAKWLLIDLLLREIAIASVSSRSSKRKK